MYANRKAFETGHRLSQAECRTSARLCLEAKLRMKQKGDVAARQARDCPQDVCAKSASRVRPGEERLPKATWRQLRLRHRPESFLQGVSGDVRQRLRIATGFTLEKMGVCRDRAMMCSAGGLVTWRPQGRRQHQEGAFLVDTGRWFLETT